jgi:hypothetical protein
MTESYVIPAKIAANAFDYAGALQREDLIPGFKGIEIYEPLKDADRGTIPSLMLAVRISDGKLFAAKYQQSADDNWWHNPWDEDSLHKGPVEFIEIVKKTRTIVETYYEEIK